MVDETPTDDFDAADALLSPEFDKAFNAFTRNLPPTARQNRHVTRAFYAGWTTGYVARAAQEGDREEAEGGEEAAVPVGS